MGAWYWIGVCVGIGVAVGVFYAGFWGARRDSVVLVPLLALASGFIAGWAVSKWQPGNWGDRAAAIVGVICGLLGAIPVVVGALRRGGTRTGTVVFLGGAALVLAGLAFVPVVGYLAAIVLPVLALLLRRRRRERYAGLRTLAKD
jgi:hypothetical protein